MKTTTTPTLLTSALGRIVPLLLALCALAFVPLASAQQTLADKLAEFDYDNGAAPRGSLVRGNDGDFYGMTREYGAENGGTVFKVTAAGVVTKLADLDPGTGIEPKGSLLLGSDGSFYGLTNRGGSFGSGTVFKMTAAGAVIWVAGFNNTTGASPTGSLVQGSDGDFYGLASGGGDVHGAGTVFKVTAAGVLSQVAEFDTVNGASPQGSLVQGSDGDFYGLSNSGGSFNLGTVFKVTAAGVLTKLADFSNASGGYPTGSLVQGSDGDFYGLASSGGANGHGTAFRVTAAGVLTKLADFNRATTGRLPQGSLVQGSDGNFYGTTSTGGNSDGASGTGTVFRLTPAGTLSVVATSPDDIEAGTIPGGYLYGDLLATEDGNFLGMTTEGGENNAGVIFRLKTALLPPTGFVLGGNDHYILPGSTTAQASDGTLLASYPAIPLAHTFTIYNRTATAVTVSGVAVTGPGSASLPRGALALPAVLAAGETLGFTVTFLSDVDAAGATVTVTSDDATTPSYAFALSGEIKRLRRLADFNYGVTGNAFGSLVQGSDGDFYGLTQYGGANGHGTAIKVTAAGVLSKLADFDASTTGAVPTRSLVQGSDGDFYGLTQFGGANGAGTAFKLTAAGVLSKLADFDPATTGAHPTGSLVQGSDGDFYGVTHSTAFRLTAAGVLSKLADFENATTGSFPTGALVQGSDGDFYGLNFYGGANGAGTAFKLTVAGVLSKLADFDFSAPTGAYPNGNLIQGSDGDFYGVTSTTAFKLTAAGVLSKVADFDATTGYYSFSLIQGSDGDFYGVAVSGGTNDQGTAFKLTAAGVLSKLADFDATTGSPAGSLVQGSDGNFYGLTQAGGATDAGTFFVLYAGLGGGALTDTTPPVTTITSTQPLVTNSSGATITFTGADNVGVTSFEGSLDGATYATVSSPVTLSGLADGAHTYQVRAKDAANNVEPFPATVSWSVDTIAPETTITSGPSGVVSSSSAIFAYSANEAATFTYSLDGGATATGAGPVMFNSLAPGAHTFTVFATDTAGNPDATPATRMWSVDMIAPETTLESGPSGTVIGDTATFTFSANEPSTFTYTLDGDETVGGSPVTFSGLAAGEHTFSVFATDTAGNVDATPATRTWTVAPGPETAVAFHGATGGTTPSPGNAVPGETGTTFKTFGIPAINDAGTVAFLTTMTTPTGSVAAVFDGTAVVARKAGATPISGTTFASFKDPALNSQGEVAFTAGLAGSVATLDKTALFTNDGGTLATVVRTDDAVPGLGGARLKTITAFQLLDDAVLFSGLLQSKTAGVAPGPGGATTANDFILCRWTAAAGVELLLREGASLGGKTVKTIATLLPDGESAGHGRKGNPNTNGLARVAFSDGTQALMEIDPAGATVIAETGGMLTNPAGAQWKTFGLPATSYSGGAAFLATLATGPGGVTSANATGLFADTNAGSNQPVARKGDTVGGFTLTAFQDPVFNDDSAVASLVTLGGAVTPATRKAILLIPNAGTATLIAQTGGEPAGVAGAQWKAFKSVALPHGLGPVFTAQMVSGASGTAGPGGVITATDMGLWALDSTGALHLLAREGVTQIDGKTLKSFAVLGAVSGSPGQTRAFNASKQLVYRATFTNGSQSLILVLLP